MFKSIFVNLCNKIKDIPKVSQKNADIQNIEKIRRYCEVYMEQNTIKMDERLEKDLKECKEKVEFLEKILTMIVKGFAPEY